MDSHITRFDKIYFDYFMKMHKKELDGLPEVICYKIFKMSRTYIGEIHNFYKNVLSNCQCNWIYGKPENNEGLPRFVMEKLGKDILLDKSALIHKISNFIEYEKLSNQSVEIIQSMINLYDMYYPKYEEIKRQMCKENFVHIFELEEKHKERLDTISDEELVIYYAYKCFKNMYYSGKYFLNRISENRIKCIPFNCSAYLSLYAAESYNNRKNIIKNVIHTNFCEKGTLYYALPFDEYSKKCKEWCDGTVEIPSPNDLGIHLMTEEEIEEYYAQFDSDGDVWTTQYYDSDSSYDQ